MSNSFPTFQKRSYLAYADKVALTEFMSHCRHFRLGDAARVAYWWCASEGWRLSPMRIRESRATRLFDRKHGTDTSTRVELSALQIDSDNRDRGVYYQASPVLSTQRVLRQLDIDFENFTFIDFGSGKGRIILLASDLPFREVLGVEFSPELHECAQRNISQYCGNSKGRVRSICSDATAFELPATNLVCYFFNPFDSVVLKSVLSNMATSLSLAPRKAFIVYHYPQDKNLFGFAPRFHLLKEWRKYCIYRWE